MNKIKITSRHIVWLLILAALHTNLAKADIVEGFPEGCYFTSIAQSLPDQELRYGMIRWQGGQLVFIYPDSNTNAFLEADIAENVGKMGFDWNADQSAELMYSTGYDKYVIAQIMDRGFELPPIVTCISQVFSGRVVYGRVPYGSDYYYEFRRIRDYRWGRTWYDRYDRWRYNWKNKYHHEWLDRLKRKYSHDHDKKHRPGRDKNHLPTRPTKPGNEPQRPTRPKRERPITIKPITTMPVREREDEQKRRPQQPRPGIAPVQPERETEPTRVGRRPENRVNEPDAPEKKRPGRR